LAYNDTQIGHLLEALRERFAPEDTLVVVTADHGEELFDHGGTLHGYTLYEELLRIPLVVWSPGRVRVGATDQPTDTLDLHATLLDLARRGGADPADPETPASHGRSLLPLLTRPAGSPGEPVQLESPARFAATWGVPGGIFALRDGPWKLIEVHGTERGSWMGLGPGRSRDRRYLFDLAADPEETENLAGLDSVREQWLLARLHAWIATQQADLENGADGADGEDAEPALDEAARKRLEALGYLD
jgi:arylsulfatase A-like enzyme